MLRTRPAPVEAQRLIESKPGLTHPLTWQKACRGRQQDGHRARKLFRPIRGRTSRSVAPEGETRCAPAMTRCPWNRPVRWGRWGRWRRRGQEGQVGQGGQGGQVGWGGAGGKEG